MIMRTGNLENEQQKLNTQAQDAAAGIVALVKSEQEVRPCFWTNCSVFTLLQTFVRLIDTRLNGIVATVKPALPTVEQRRPHLKYLLSKMAHTERCPQRLLLSKPLRMPI